MRTYVLWGLSIGDNRHIRIGASRGRDSPLPFGAEVIATVDAEDLRLMRRWCERRARRGWTVERMRSACEVS
jgi:hypothetical protein